MRTRAVAAIVFVAAAPIATAQSTAVLRLLEEGSGHYMQQDYKGAIGPYAKALDLEKKQRTLDKTLWRVLVDNLGMAYGVTGDLARSKETFEYGISKDATYPMFYYNIACTYAEMNDLDKAIANLKLAFRYKANVIAGESVPDPRSDSSFQRFLGNPRFQNALRGIGPIQEEAPQTDRLTVTSRAATFALAVPVSQLVMSIPKEGFRQKTDVPPDSSPRYFYFEDATSRVILSGWFEPEHAFPGMDAFWAAETKAWTASKLPNPTKVTFRKIGGWDAVTYQISGTSHVRAHYLQAGTWIDLHLSVPGEGAEEKLAALLRRVLVKAK